MVYNEDGQATLTNEKEEIMTAKCACRKVYYTPISNEDGTCIEQWMCLDCKSIFVRKVGNVAQPNACPQLSDVRALLQAIDDFHDSFTVQECSAFSKKSLNAGVNLIHLKNKLSEHF